MWHKNKKLLNFPIFVTSINSIGRSYLYLLLAIVFEIIATTFLKKSEEFSKLLPSVVTVIGYSAAFYFLSLTLRQIPVGITYAIWSGIGIVCITIIGIIAFKQVPDLPAVIGIALIIIGVIVINLFSKMGSH
ncbi:DMT family transporter [Chryseobacterium tongliaoense]|uniref:DMT family transporter n=1 Tax=Chryseobacterium tongliaoense TaxID=3240933 RepID=UPI00351586D7